jgi:hypothetical protein
VSTPKVCDAQSYDFESVAFRTFISAAQAHGDLTLLLSDPTEREVRRHIEERSAQALQALTPLTRGHHLLDPIPTP